LGEITLDLRLVIKIPSSKLTINGLVLGLKQSAPQIQATILTTLLEALEEKAVRRYLDVQQLPLAEYSRFPARND
jgi:hypothetical protein